MLFLFHSVSPSTFNVVAMGTADVQAVCNVLKEAEEQEKTAGQAQRTSKRKQSKPAIVYIHVVLVSIIIDMHKENVDK